MTLRIASCCLLLCAWPTSSAGALPDATFPGDESRAVDRAQEPVPADTRSEKVKRVLQLASGARLRSLCFFAEGLWQVRMDSRWIPLEERDVVQWRTEAEIQREASKLSRELGPKDHGQRVEFAGWLLQSGFVEEALEEVERVLHLEPDFPSALELLNEPGIPRMSGGNAEAEPQVCMQRLFGAGVSAGPVERELLIDAMGELSRTEQGRQVLRETLRTELVSPRILRRTLAAHAMRRLLKGEELFDLMRRCILDSSRPVREEAARALTATRETGIVVPLVRALASESRQVRTNAAESLGNIGFASAVPALVTHFANLPQGGGSSMAKVAAHIYIGSHFSYVGDFDLEIAQGASIADPIVFQGEEAKILDVRLAGISGYTYRTEYRNVYGSLKQLTDANPGSSPSDWQRWYEENKSNYERDDSPQTDE